MKYREYFLISNVKVAEVLEATNKIANYKQIAASFPPGTPRDDFYD